LKRDEALQRLTRLEAALANVVAVAPGLLAETREVIDALKEEQKAEVGKQQELGT
jgi:hypothetical protein